MNTYTKIQNIFQENNCDEIRNLIKKDRRYVQTNGEIIWPYCSIEGLKIIINIYEYEKGIHFLLDDCGDFILESIISYGRINLLKYLINTFNIKYQDIIDYNITFRDGDIKNFINSGMYEYLVNWKNTNI